MNGQYLTQRLQPSSTENGVLLCKTGPNRRAADVQPVPRTVGEWLADSTGISLPPTEVHVLQHQRDLREIEADEWVGASVAILEPWQQDRLGMRMQFVSPDERNDWAFDLEFRAGR